MPFSTTIPKDMIRSTLDKKAVSDLAGRKKRTLSYFGLCGPDMLDVLEWREFIGPCSAVELDDPLKLQRLWDTAFSEKVHQNLEVLHGDIDNIMRDWKDIYQKVPSQHFYDLLNLDYQGGIMYKDLRGDSRRLDAIRRMIERQSKAHDDFLLLITVNTRNRGQSEFDLALEDMREEAKGWGVDISPIIDWYLSQPFDQKLKLYLPYILNQYTVPLRIDLITEKVISYVGAGDNRMVHFIFEMMSQKDRAVLGRKESIMKILNLSLTKVEEGRFAAIKTPDLPVKQLQVARASEP